MLSEIVNDRFCPPVIACFRDLTSKNLNSLVLISFDSRERRMQPGSAERSREASVTFLVADGLRNFG